MQKGFCTYMSLAGLCVFFLFVFISFFSLARKKKTGLLKAGDLKELTGKPYKPNEHPLSTHRGSCSVVWAHDSYLTPPELVLYTHCCHVDHSLSRMWQTKYESLFRFHLNTAWLDSCTSMCFWFFRFFFHLSIKAPYFANLTFSHLVGISLP